MDFHFDDSKKDAALTGDAKDIVIQSAPDTSHEGLLGDLSDSSAGQIGDKANTVFTFPSKHKGVTYDPQVMAKGNAKHTYKVIQSAPDACPHDGDMSNASAPQMGENLRTKIFFKDLNFDRQVSADSKETPETPDGKFATLASEPAAGLSEVLDDKDDDFLRVISKEPTSVTHFFGALFNPEHLHPRVESLIYWRNVKQTGLVFGTGLVMLLAISIFSVVSLFAYISLLLMVGTFAFQALESMMSLVKPTSAGHPFKYSCEECLELILTVSVEKVQHAAGIAVVYLNGCTAELQRLLLGKDAVRSIKFGVTLWAMTYIGAWFNGTTLLIIAFFSLFTLPKVWETNKESIESYLELAQNKLRGMKDAIKMAIPLGECDKNK